MKHWLIWGARNPSLSQGSRLFHFLCQERTKPKPLSLVTEPLDPRHPKYMDGSEGTETAPSQCPLLTDRDHSWEPRGSPEQGNGANNNYSNAECQFLSLGSSIKTHNSKRHVGPASYCLSAGTDCLDAGVMALQAHWTHLSMSGREERVKQGVHYRDPCSQVAPPSREEAEDSSWWARPDQSLLFV